MDKSRRELLETAGVNVDEVLGRFMNNEALAMKFLCRFPGDENFSKLMQAMDRQDATGAFEAAHTLKGVAGNLSIQNLFQQVSALVEDLRTGDLAAAAGKMPPLEEEYARVLAALRQLT